MAIDTSAVVARLLDEPEADSIENALVAAGRCFMSALTLFECHTVLWGRLGARGLYELGQFMGWVQPTIVPFDADQAGLAFAAYCRFGKGSGHPARLNLCDCAAYALATSQDLPLLFKGNDFPRADVRPALA